MKVQTVHMHQVHGVSGQSVFDELLMYFLTPFTDLRIERSSSGRRWDQGSPHGGSLGGNHKRAVTGLDQRTIEQSQYLFRTSYCIFANFS